MMRNRFIYFLAIMIAIVAVIYACQNENDIKRAQYFANGKSLFITHCANCHGDQGEGLGKMYPPLNDTLSIANHRENLACMVRFGLTEPTAVHGFIYDTPMPPNEILTAQDIAYILTYVGNSFNNQLGLIDENEVKKTLNNCK